MILNLATLLQMSNARKTIIKEDNINPYKDREGLIYARVSSKRQEVEGSGLDSQELRCVNDLLSIKVPHTKTFQDSYTGAGDFMKRPAMKDLLEYVDERPHKKFVVVFDDLKRFARDTEFHFKLRATFKIRNVSLRCLNYNFDDTPEGVFTETIFAAQGQLEREQNKRQVIQKQKARLELGYWAFGSKKGYKMTKSPQHGTISIPYGKEARILREALEGFASGKFVRKVDVCKFLVENKFWTKQSPEKYIDKLTKFISDPFYAGFIEYPAWEVERRLGKHKGIISLETFEFNQKRLGNLDFGKRIRVDTSDDFPLRGLLVCADCKSHLTAGWIKGRNKKHPYYWCQKKSCNSYWKTHNREVIESGFAELLQNTKLKEDVSSLVELVFNKVWGEKISNLKHSQKNAQAQKLKAENKIEEITNLMLAAKSETLKHAYENQIERIGEEIEKIDSEPKLEQLDLNVPYRTALHKAKQLIRSPYSVWVNLSTKEQQSLFYFIFENKLAYSRIEGYRTAQLPSAIRLFEDFTTSDTQDVEMRGIEPRCRRLFL